MAGGKGKHVFEIGVAPKPVDVAFVKIEHGDEVGMQSSLPGAVGKDVGKSFSQVFQGGTAVGELFAEDVE